MVPDDGGGGGGGVPCDYCAAQRALVHCAQHGTRLCLLCDVPVHAATARAHQRAPLCEGCHAAPAAARCAVHRASLCAHCARAAGCDDDAQGHDRSPTRSYTGFPDPADLARILYIDAPLPSQVPPPLSPPQPPPDTWVPDLVNVELQQAADLPGGSSRSLDERTVMTNQLPSSSLIQTGGNFENQAVAGDGSAAAAGGGEGDAGLFTRHNSDWYNHLPEDDPAGAGGGLLDDSNFVDDWNWSLTEPLVNPLEEPETAWWSSSGYDDPWPLNPSSSYSSETVVRTSTDHAMESLAGNNAAFRLSSSVMNTAANTSTNTTPYQLDLLTPVHQLHLQQGNPDWLLPPHQLPPQCKFFNSGLPMWPPDEFPSRHLGVDEHLTPEALGSTTVVHQDQDMPLQQQQQPASSAPMPVPVPVPVPVLEQGSSQDMEARTKLQEKREEAKQRYKDKKKNRRFGKQIMYVSRKVRADTRNRVKGRFAKASSGGGGQGDFHQSTQHGHGDGDQDDHPTHS